ncbi:MAG: hypothetical protein WA004_21630 [Saprospiraceae bacterium]
MKLTTVQKSLALFGLIGVAVITNYFMSDAVASLFYIATLVAYFNSKDEPFWLTFFFVLSDGFIGFFNNYEAVMSAIPGLPPVEVGQFYIALTLVKAAKVKKFDKPFYFPIMGAMLVYVIFLFVQSYTLGVSPELNAQFRIIKYLLPLALFYSIPKLFEGEDQYRQTFALFIPFAFFALLAQVITISTSLAPSQLLGVHQDLWFIATTGEGKTYRGFYSTNMVLISFFGALFYSATKDKYFNKTLLFAVIAADFLSAFLSATRGWVLCFTFATLLHLIFVLRMSAGQLSKIVITATVALVGLMSLPVVNKQFSAAFERLETLQALAGGDVTAKGTLARINDRLPKVVKKWEESPLTGWGFSDDFFKYGDFHVGNHNILLQAGILGALLMALFLGYFQWKLFQRSMSLPAGNIYKNALLVFPVFFMGWFIIHSSSGQQFMFYGDPAGTIGQAIYFAFGAVIYRQTLRE